MRARNLFFLGFCGVALWAFAASVLPRPDDDARPVADLDFDSLMPVVQRVDAAFEVLWRTNGSTPAPRADELVIARRLSLALTGTIPSLEEIRRFERLPGDDRLQRLMAERLVERRYADYVAERLARAYVGVDDGPFLLYRRRRFVSWLADRLDAGTPYDQLVRHLIADVGLWTDTPSTNFVTVTIKPDDNKGPDENMLAARVARAFLGVRLDCAECHDHPFDRWKQRDFQSLAAFFGTTRHSLRGIRDVPGEYEVENRQTDDMERIDCEVPFAKELLPEGGPDRKRLAAWLTDRGNRAFAHEAVNRAWALLFGRPLVDPIDNLPLEDTPPALDILADDFSSHGYDWRRLLAAIALTRAFACDSRMDSDSEEQKEWPNDWSAFPLTRLRPEQVVGGLLQSARLATIDASSHILVRIARAIGQREFIERYGDAGAEEFEVHGGTIPQRLLMMNGKIMDEKTKDSLLANAATQIAVLAPDEESAVETAMLAVLTRRPTEVEKTHFVARLADKQGPGRKERLGDLYWTLLNSTEFSWNH
jgi:hypothetical protein